jgi:hypothetical protein
VVRQLDDLKQVILTDKQLIQLFHTNGINMRHLGLAFKTSSQAHVKVLFATAMLARTAKRVFLTTLSQRWLEPQKEESLSRFVSQQIVDFLNLLLGNSDETRLFYQEVLYPRTHGYFGVSLDDICAVELQPVTLYNFFLSQAKIEVVSSAADPKPAFDSESEQSSVHGESKKSDQMFWKRLFKTE